MDGSNALTGLIELQNARRLRAAREDFADGTERAAVPFKTETVEPFPVDVFPSSLARFVAEGAASLNCPPDFIGVPMLSVAGALIGTSNVIRPKPDRTEYARIWTIVVGNPGSAKTPALETVLEPLHSIQAELKDRFDLAEAAYEDAMTRWAQDRKQPRPQPPVMEQIYTTDTTIEALAELLSRNQRGLLIYQEEAAGWVLSMNQYKGGKGSDKQNALSLWSGAPIVGNRKGKQAIYVPKPFVGFTGGIQPDVLAQLRNEMSEADGFIHRFLIVQPDRVQKRRTDAILSSEAKESWSKACQALRDLQPAENGPYPFAFSPDGLEAWNAWQDDHYAEQNTEDFPEYLEGPWAKIDAYALRLALVVHLLRAVAGEIPDDADVDAETMRRVDKLIRYFKSHARRVYGQLRETPEDRKVRQAVAWLEKRGGEATIRDLVRYKVAGTKTADDAEALANLLIKRGHATKVTDSRTTKIQLVMEEKEPDSSL
ncbi:YfjI family protein [Kyrpidia spormannii]|nr:YfjI family protein [Kyrpidia spormannii]